jgi:hypothetical protein
MVVMPSNFLAYVLILSSRCVCFVFQGCFMQFVDSSLESLILAQDERLRRA